MTAPAGSMGGSAAQSASVTLQLDGHPHAFASVNEAIAWQARERPQKTAFVFLKDGETEAGRLDFGALHARAATIAEALSAQGARGERALLVFQNGLEFMAAFLGCLYAGTIPVPVYPPLSRRSHWQRLNDIAGDCQASWILATQDYLSDLDDHLEDLAALGVCERMPISLCAPIEYLVAPTGPVYMPGPTDIAFLQYTSGSTSAPKGVMVSHGNLLHNIGMMQQAFSHDQDSVLVSWLPLFHDMGLIGNVLQAACLGATCYVMTPAAFLQSPMRWLRALSRYRGTSSFAPDFAYELCVQRANETELAGLDLSHWSMALNGAEPVRARTLQRFAETFAPCGFDARALYPGYGLAEGTLFAAGGGHLAGARTITLDAALFDAEGKVQCTEAATGRRMVASGRAWAGSRIAIVDAQTHRRCEDGEVGEIWLSGPSVCMGYWGRSDSRVATFCARIAGESDRDYLRTGDLGFMLDQDLFVAGRMKEVVILRGSNHYPQDLEAAVQSAVPALKPSGGAAFAMEIDGEERLVMVQEVERTRMRGLDAEAVFAGMRQALLQEFGVAAHGLVLIRPASLPKTSSGKIQRGRARDLFASGELDVLARWTAGPSSEAVAVPATEGWLRHLIDSVARHARIDVAGIAPECSIADLGMDSLSLAGVQHDLAALGASDVPMRVFFGDGRLSSIAAHLQQNAPPPAPARGIVTATDTVAAEGGMALSDNQRQLLLLDAVAAPGSAYHVPVCIRADFEPGLVRIALSALIQRHEVLRTRYRTELDGFSQHVEPAGDVDFQVEVAVGDDDAVVARLCSACRTPMDLSAGRVLRVLMLTPQRERQMADLLFVFHHIAVDLTSARLLIAEFGQTYAALAAGRLPAALPAAVPYRRFIEARQHRAFSPKGAADARYWAQVLADDTPLLQLPFDRARPALQTFRGSSLDVPLPGLRDGVRAAAARLGVTAHALLLSVYQLWLSRLSGQSDFLVAVPMSGRDDPGLAGCVGYCVAPAILKVQVVPGQTLVQLAHAQQLALAQAWDHQAGAMAALLARAERAGDRSAPPVFQSLFAYYTAERDALSPFGGGDNDTIRVGGLECQVRHLQATGAQLDLSLLVADNGESLCARVEFNSDLFDAATVARFGDSFATLLAAGCADPERAVQHLPMLSAQEAERVAGAWTTSAVDYAESRFLHELIDAQALDAPEAVALQIGDATMSREALRLASDRVAVQLQAHGVGPEDRVGIFLERSLEMVIALLGTLKAGAAYVPVDPELPAARRQAIVDAAGVAVLLVQNGLQESAAVHGIATLCVALAPDAATMSAPAPVALADDNSAYLIYTSGSTGRPKGVVNTHGAIRNRILWMQQAYGLQCSDRVLQKTPFTFDVSVWEFFWPLIQGATLVVAAPGIHRDAEALGALMREQGVTHLHFVPSMLQAFLEVGAQDVPSLRQVYCSGEELPAPLVRRFAQAYPGVALHNLYGPTEAAVDVSYWPCGAEPDASRIPIGHPIANVQLYVLDRWMQPVPVGVAGELYIGGTGLARGYLGSPGLTAASFVPAPYGEPGARLYRSGDLARQRSDGAVEYLGRIDNQVKLRGFRIELGEVEAHLLAQPGVREAAAIVRADGTEPVLVAFVCGSMLQASALRMALTGLLPNYMVPTHICVLSAMPLSANGKIDRRALPAIELEREAQVAASTPHERALAAAWCSVLGLDSVGINERFFDLGGHSLLAAKLVAQLRSHHGLVLAVRDVFEAPTIAAQALRVQGTGEGGEEGARLVPVARGADAPLSAAQQRLWFLAQLDGPAATYNMPAAIVLHGALDVPALVQALQAVVARHEVLRSTYHERDGEPRQRVQPVEAFQVALEDCSQHPPAERDARVQQYVQAHAGTPFDLAVDLPIRAGVLRLGEQEHVLALCLHHIAGDGWSVGVLRRELSQAYQAARGQGPALEPLALQYIDYAHWQRSWLSEARQQAQLGYWQQQLAALPPLLELPTDRARPAVQSHRGGSLDVQLPAHLVGPLKQLAQSRQASLFMVLLAGFQAILARYSGQDDIAVGSPVANRPRAELEGLIGFFVNTLVLRAQVDPHTSFQSLLEQVRETTLAAYDHADVPFEQLVEVLQPARSLSHGPLFQVMFDLQHADTSDAMLSELRAEPLGDGLANAKFDLQLTLGEGDGQVSGTLQYAADLFDASSIARLWQHYVSLLEQAVASPQRRLDAVELLDESERQQLQAWNATAQPLPAQSLPCLFSAQARRTPAAEAVASADGSLDYATLDAQSQALAQHLHAHGVRAEDRIGICLPRELQLPVALLGILKAGAAYVPLDPQYPDVRLAQLIEDAGLHRVVASPAQRERLQALGLEVITLDQVGVLAAPVSVALPAPDPRQVAYVLFTSGSTGRPKGIQTPHQAIVRLLFGVDYVDLSRPRRILHAAPLSFDASTFELWAALLQGGTCVMYPDAVPTAPELAAIIAGQRVDTAWLTASLFHALVDEDPQCVAGLQQLLVGGDVVSVAHVARVQQAAPALRLINGYGPTESTTFAACHPIAHGVSTQRAIPIGRPIGNTALHVLDAHMQPLPVGVAGELYIGGQGLARSYLRAGLSAERFVPDPFSRAGGERLYRTGDRVRRLADGSLDYLGRLDRQVKLRGFRIELGEVEAALARLPGVQEAVVSVTGEGEVRSLVAHVTGPALQPAQVRAALAEQLPAYMVPAQVMVLEAMPLTANGKIDRRALPAIELEREAQVAASTPHERALAAAWCSVLGLDSVGINERFFDLGGHSLLAAKLVAQLRSHHGLVLAVRDVFEAPTIAAQALRVQGTGEGGEEGARLVPVARGADAPLSAAQQRLWFLAQLDGPAATYNMPAAIVLHGALDVPALVQALQAVVARHEVLRSTYHERDGEPRQRVQPVEAFQVALEDCSQHPPAERDARVQQYVQAHAGTPFDLAVDLPIRAGVLRLGEQEHVLALCLHHIAGDGWSVGVLRRELSQAYQAARGQGPALEPLALQYIDYAHWQRSWLSEARQQAQLGYWQQQLAALPPLLELPTDRARPAVQSHRGGSLDVQLPAHLVGPLKQLAQSRQASLFMVLLAGFQAILARYSGQDDIAVGSPVANRPRAELEGLIGFFVNTLVLRAQVDPHTSFQSLLEQVRETTLAAYDHADVPFEQLVEVLQPARSLSHGPLFQVMFDLQHADTSDAMLSELRAEPLGDGLANAKFDLQLTLGEGDGQVSGTLQYAADLFDASSIARLWQHYVSLLEQAVASPQRRLDAMELLDESERQQLLVHWNQTGAQYPQATIHGLFQAQAARTPDAVAVYDGTEPLTYRALDEASTGLAQHLRALGVGTEDRVGICLPRDAQLLVALLAVLKAGAAYVPLDPQYPDVRIGHILDSAQPSVLLTVSTECARLAPLAGSQTQLLALDAVRPHHNSATALPTTLPEQLAYVIYTSGSTGLPKGVAITHANAVAMLDWARSTYPDPVLRHTLAATSICFDLSVYELFLPLLTGNSVVLVRDALALTEQAPPVAVSLINTVPSAMEALLAAHAVPASVRVVNLAGEALGRGLVERLYALGHVEAVYNLYGPSEDTTYSTGTLVDRGGADRPSIGRPLSNTRAYVLDEALRPVPVGVRGELYLTGAGLSRGYQGRAALTAERYLPNPFAGTPGERLYRTGDIVRYLADGRLDYLGRADHQVKLRGFRIELGEVEAALARQPGVREVVAVVQGQGSSQHLLAYASGDMLQGADLRRQLARELPAYMVPTQVIVLEALPLTANGKIDRRALPVGNTNAVSTYLAPRNEREKQIAAIWSDVLAIDAPSVDVSFFDLGGHSLLANRLVAALKRELAQDLRVRHIFDAPTIESLALLIGGQKHTPAGMEPMQQHGSGTPLFLIHPVGGDVLCYLPLVRAAGLQCAVHAIQRDELASGTPARYEDLRALAGRYLARIRNIQPLGPYRIAGWSMGGVIAAHIADLLQACGQQVEYLGIIDSFLRTPAEIADAALADDGTPEEAFQHMVQKLSADAELRAHFDQSMHLDRLHSVLDPEELQRLRAITAAGVVAARRSPSVGLPVNAHYYCAAIPAGPHLDGKLDRHAQAGGNPARVRMLEGDHHSIMEPPQIHALAAAIAADIANGSPTQTATDADRAVMETL